MEVQNLVEALRSTINLIYSYMILILFLISILDIYSESQQTILENPFIVTPNSYISHECCDAHFPYDWCDNRHCTWLIVITVSFIILFMFWFITFWEVTPEILSRRDGKRNNCKVFRGAMSAAITSLTMLLIIHTLGR